MFINQKAKKIVQLLFLITVPYFSQQDNIKNIQNLTSQNWNWQFKGAPLGDTTVEGILVEPENENIWYVSSIENGLYITRDNGSSWEHPLTGRGLNTEGYQIDPKNTSRLLVALFDKLFISNDKGVTWKKIYTCPESIRSILISKVDGSIYLTPQTAESNSPGIYKSTDGGATFTHLLFGVSTEYMICWDIEEDPQNGYLYTGIELADHPKPYNPPFFRSMDGGKSWQEISGILPWHGLKIQVDPSNHKVYYLIEGGSLYESIDFGENWQLLSSYSSFFLLLDINNDGYMYSSGNPKYSMGGAHLSINYGKTFKTIGLDSLNVTSVALNSTSTKLFAVCYGSGIWRTNVPEIITEEDTTKIIIVTNTEDSGEGSLRNAIKLANTNIGADTIKFNIPKTDPNFDSNKGIWVISPVSRMTVIYDSNLVIDGISQRVFIEEDTNPEGPEIVINGNAGLNRGLEVSGGNGTEIYEVTLNNFNYSGISFIYTERGTVSGCYIGTDYTGMKSAGMNSGIYLHKSNNIKIGPSSYLDKPNVISGNRFYGIYITDSCSYNLIVENYIGVNKITSDTVGNTDYGIGLENFSYKNIIERNIICGSFIGITGKNSNQNKIRNNFIGTNKAFEKDLANDIGILLWSNSSNNQILENTIWYNKKNGVQIDSSNSIRNIISRNSICRNLWSGIENNSGGNTELTPPVITSVNNNEIKGRAGANQIIEIFADSSNQGQVYIDSTITDESGNFTFSISSLPILPNITATARDVSGNTSEFSSPFVITNIEERKNEVPSEFALYQNYPNPFNPSTIIKYTIPVLPQFSISQGEGVRAGLFVSLTVYDILGREVATLVNRKQAAGNYEVGFNASNLPSGVYFYQLKVNGFISTKKMLITK